jgi:methionyl-tRNA formyltransferase
MTQSSTIVFFGNERLATGVTTTAPTLQSLINAGYHVAAVVSNYTTGTSRNSRELEIASIAEAHDIPVLLPKKVIEIKDQLAEYGAEVAVLAAYGQIVPESILELFPKGILNIHPSLLPLHRGPTPIENAILEGARQTGVSIMKLVKAMDAGPVATQESLGINGTETKQELADMLLEKGAKLLINALPQVLDNTIKFTPQDEARATYDPLISKSDGELDWNKSAETLEREIRAYQEWPKSRTNLAGTEVVITKAHTAAPQDASEAGSVYITKDKHIAVHCANGVLIIEALKPAGKPEMSAEAFLAGYGNKL